VQFLDPQWQPAMISIGMGDFSSVWDFPLERVDNPNQGRGGWSEVCYYQLPAPVFDTSALYIKRQQDYSFIDWRSPIKGLPTFQREYANLVWCIERGLPVVKPVAFGVRDKDGHRQAILVTQALDEYFSLDQVHMVAQLGIRLRKTLIKSVAAVIKNMHQSGLQHGCLYPKHIFVNKTCRQGEPVDVRLIDFEKASLISIFNKGVFRDLDTLNRRSYEWSVRDRICFLGAYCDGDKEEIKRLITRLEK